MDYTQLAPQTRLTAVQNRIRDLETQYMSLELRVQAPDVNTPPGNNDAQNLQRLDASLQTLHTMETDLENQINNPTPPAPAADTSTPAE